MFNNVEFITLEEVKSIIDYSNPSDRDIEGSYIFLNTWAAQWADIDWSLALAFIDLVKFNGIRKTIELALLEADCILHPEKRVYCSTAYFRDAIMGLDRRTAFQLLRYGKRFGYADDDSLSDASIKSFISNNNRMKQINRRPVCGYLREKLKHIFDDIFAGYEIGSHYELPKGAVGDIPGFDTPDRGDSVSKFIQAQTLLSDYGGYNPLYDSSRLYPATRWYNPYTKVRTPFGERVIPHVRRFPYTFNRIVAVPKNYKTARTIAIEPIDRQMLAGKIAEGIENCMMAYNGPYSMIRRVDLHDQSRNRFIALRASTDNSIATVDLKAASDSISYRITDLLPAKLAKDIDTIRSNYSLVNGKPLLLHCYLTMGNRVTFPLETVVFWGVICVVVEIHNSFSDDAISLDSCSTYGDDIEVPVILVPLLKEVLTELGFQVNDEKTCDGPDNFRESCGLDAWFGTDVSTKYWPRRAYDADWSDGGFFTSMIDLQHRLVSSPNATKFLHFYLKSKKPSLQQTEVGYNALTLWGRFPNIVENRETYSVKIRDLSGKKAVSKIETVTIVSRKVTTVVTKYNRVAASEECDLYAYNQFLEFGPYYPEPLLRLLGISFPRPLAGGTLRLKNTWVE